MTESFPESDANNPEYWANLAATFDYRGPVQLSENEKIRQALIPEDDIIIMHLDPDRGPILTKDGLIYPDNDDKSEDTK